MITMCERHFSGGPIRGSSHRRTEHGSGTCGGFAVPVPVPVPVSNDGEMDDVTIRPARSEELRTVAELRWRWEQERHGTPAVPRDEFVRVFAAWARENDSSHRCTVVLRDGVVIGMAWLAIVPRVPLPRAPERITGDMQCVYVVPEERDSGIGGRLIDAVLALARDLGAEWATVHSSERAIPAYTRRGFVASPQLLQADLAGVDRMAGRRAAP